MRFPIVMVLLATVLGAQDGAGLRACRWFQKPRPLAKVPREPQHPSAVGEPGLLITKLFDGKGIVYPGIRVQVEPMANRPGQLRVQAEGRTFQEVPAEGVLPWNPEAAIAWVIQAMDEAEWTPEVRFQAAEAVLEAFGDHPLRREARLRQARVAVQMEDAEERARARSVLEAVLKVHGRSPVGPELRWLRVRLGVESGPVEGVSAVERLLEAYGTLTKAELQGIAPEVLLERRAELHALAGSVAGDAAQAHREAAVALYERLAKGRDRDRATRARAALERLKPPSPEPTPTPAPEP